MTLDNIYFLDTEFHEAGPDKPVQLISIGLVSRAGRTFYAEAAEYNRAKASPWLKEHVLPNLTGPTLPRAVLRKRLVEFVKPAEKPTFWGYFADYDWVLFSQIFGAMIKLPEGLPMYCLDLKQEMDRLKLKRSDLPRQLLPEHNALADAQWNRDVYLHLENRA